MKAAQDRDFGGCRTFRLWLVSWCIALAVILPAKGQDPVPQPPEPVNTNRVTINVDNGPITQVLNAFSRQTGRSIVIGPEVAGNVTLRVNGIPWQDALTVMLKPYGYAYYLVGETVIICGVDKVPKGTAVSGKDVLAALANVAGAPPAKVEEPVQVKVFTLKYLDASDVEPLVREMLTPNVGKTGKLLAQSQSWQEQQVSDNQSTSSESLGRLRRFQEESRMVGGKVLVVVDTAERLRSVAELLAKIDRKPVQVQIEAKFIEVSANRLRDIGVEWGTGTDGSGTPIGTTGASSLYSVGARSASSSVKPDSFKPLSSPLSGTAPFNSGLTLAFQKLTDLQFASVLHLLEEDASYKMLSSPQVMTLDNQDAVILVGQKLPIVSTSTGPGDTAGTTKTTTDLKRYEDVGIKLKVLPHVCDDNNINLVIHPSVRELLGYQSGNSSASDPNSITEGAAYPIIAAREAETQVMVKSGLTIVIGGMIRDKKQTTQIKVPVLGSIPILGALFRRDTVNTEKVELLIFLTARIAGTADEMAVANPPATTLIKVEKPAKDKGKH